tara:strand:+ start:161 stop:454 length:294 start_codon:yes stop_codon:yes gene_type:complete
MGSTYKITGVISEGADVFSEALICDEVQMDEHCDIFGNRVFRSSETYYNVVYPDGDNEWIRSDFVTKEMIISYESFKLNSVKDCIARGCVERHTREE